MDYQQIGFKAGLECHQQLDGKKLFCNCTTINSDKEPDIKVTRKLRAVAGETGEIDIAAEYEMAKNKEFIYLSNSEDSCLVEYDCEPPHNINKEALKVSLEVAMMLNAKIVDEIQVMRKTVIDGSNTSGFQRTALIAQDGYIETSLGKVRIPTICLEEEASQKIKEDEKSVTYRLDRLGIPLIEVATEADIKNPEHAKEVASYIGMVLRSTGKCKRGIGTIRQDVNISIKNGTRTEIKGFQELKSIPKIIENEILRQESLIKQGKKLEKEVRKAEPDFTTSFLRPMPSSARMYPETDVEPIRINKKYIEELRKGLPKLLTDRIDEFKIKYNLNKETVKQIIKLKYNFEDLIKYSTLPITKKIQEDLVLIDKLSKSITLPINELKKIQELSKNIVESINGPITQVKKIHEQINKVGNSLVYATMPLKEALNRLESISKLIALPKITVRTLINTIPEIKREGVNVENLTEEQLKEILKLVAEDKISKESIPEILKDLDKGYVIKDIIKRYPIVSEDELEKEIKKIIEEKKRLSVGAYMGIIMAKFKGKVDGKKAMEILKSMIR